MVLAGDMSGVVPLGGPLGVPCHGFYQVIRRVGCIVFITCWFLLQVLWLIYINPEVSLSHPAWDIVAEVPVLYRVVHPAGDRWGEALVQGGRAVRVCFQG